MLSMTIKAFIKKANKPGITQEPYRLYLVKEDDVIFYIGQSRNTHNRLLSHLGYGTGERGSGPSNLGTFILENAPDSGAWIVEQYTLEECRRADLLFDVDTIEEAMIHQYRPCLNVACNPDPTPLPERYQRKDDGENPYGKKLEIMYGMVTEEE